SWRWCYFDALGREERDELVPSTAPASGAHLTSILDENSPRGGRQFWILENGLEFAQCVLDLRVARSVHVYSDNAQPTEYLLGCAGFHKAPGRRSQVIVPACAQTVEILGEL